MERAALKVVENTPEKSAEPATFEDFWTLYPRKEARKEALKSWSRIGEVDRLEAVVALVDWRRVWHARADYRYTPLPATWLNGERWTDELPAEHRQRPQSHAPVAARPDVPKGEMPEHVKALIARMRNK